MTKQQEAAKRTHRLARRILYALRKIHGDIVQAAAEFEDFGNLEQGVAWAAKARDFRAGIEGLRKTMRGGLDHSSGDDLWEASAHLLYMLSDVAANNDTELAGDDIAVRHALGRAEELIGGGGNAEPT